MLPVTRFGSILRESTDETLHIESDGQGTTIRGQRSQFKLPAENPAEFPPVADFAEENYFEISARLLRGVPDALRHGGDCGGGIGHRRALSRQLGERNFLEGARLCAAVRRRGERWLRKSRSRRTQQHQVLTS